MPKADFIPQKLRVWIEARNKLKLSHKHIQMARELGMNPKGLGRLNNPREAWKAPLPEFIEDLYFKRFKKEGPDEVMSIEEIAKAKMKKKEQKKALKAEVAESASEETDSHCPF